MTAESWQFTFETIRMLSIVEYAAADCKLAVLLPLYSITGSRVRLANYNRCISSLRRQGVPYYTVEAAFDGNQFQLQPDGFTLQVQAAGVCWQKERLLNLLEPLIPAQYSQLAWVDADVLFDDDGWASRAAEQLEHTPWLQLFRTFSFLDLVDRVQFGGVGMIVANAMGLYGHPGYAWACSRELWRYCGGLFDAAGSMSADLMMARASLRMPDDRAVAATASVAWKSWRSRLRQYLRDTSVVGMSGNVRHLWHGSVQTRGYMTLNSRLVQLAFDPDADLVVDAASGTWRLNREDVAELLVSHCRDCEAASCC
jgi:hypothetical protein